MAGIAGVVLVAENPADHHIFLSSFVGERELLATSSGITVTTPRGEIQVMDPAAFASHLGSSAPDVSEGARLAAILLRVVDPVEARDVLSQSRATLVERMGRLAVQTSIAMGATLVFEAA